MATITVGAGTSSLPDPNFWETNADLHSIFESTSGSDLLPSDLSTPTSILSQDAKFPTFQDVNYNMQNNSHNGGMGAGTYGMQDMMDYNQISFGNMSSIDPRQQQVMFNSNPYSSVLQDHTNSFIMPQNLQNLDSTTISNTNLDFFSMDDLSQNTSLNHNPRQSIASISSSVHPSPHQSHRKSISSQAHSAPGDPPIKVQKKRGRKRKVLTPDGLEAERQKLLEKNRVAANRCRERKKEWMHKLEERKSQLEYDNAALKQDLEELSNEVMDLRMLLAKDCGCATTDMVSNMKESLMDSKAPDHVVDNLVGNLLRLRTGSLDASVGGNLLPSTRRQSLFAGFGSRDGSYRGISNESPNSAASEVESIFSRRKQSATSFGLLETHSNQTTPIEDEEVDLNGDEDKEDDGED